LFSNHDWDILKNEVKTYLSDFNVNNKFVNKKRIFERLSVVQREKKEEMRAYGFEF
jgi:hypothetical protein